MSSFSIGLGPMPWIINSEIYPTNLRGTGISMYYFSKSLLCCFRATSVNWISNFFVSFWFLTATSDDVGEVVMFEVFLLFLYLIIF